MAHVVEQHNWYDRHYPHCTVWETPITEQAKCNCPGKGRDGGAVPNIERDSREAWLEDLEYALDNGYSKAEICEMSNNVEWDNVNLRVRRAGRMDLLQRLRSLSKREHEWLGMEKHRGTA